MPCPCATHLPNQPDRPHLTSLITPCTQRTEQQLCKHSTAQYGTVQCDSPVAVVWVPSALLRLGGDDGVELLPLLVPTPVMRELLGFVDGSFLETLAARVHGERYGPVTRMVRDLAWFAARLDGRPLSSNCPSDALMAFRCCCCARPLLACCPSRFARRTADRLESCTGRSIKSALGAAAAVPTLRRTEKYCLLYAASQAEMRAAAVTSRSPPRCQGDVDVPGSRSTTQHFHAVHQTFASGGVREVGSLL